MASYAQGVKNELSRKLDDDRDCRRAEFVALMKVGAKKIDGRLEFISSNAAVVRRVITLAKKFFPNVKPEVAALRKKKLHKDLSYSVRFLLTDELKTFLAEVDSPDFLKRTRHKVAYLRGAFLAAGTVNRPEAQYLLQIATKNIATTNFIRSLLEKLEFRAGFYQRRNFFVTWLREADSICDFLGMIGASEAVERFEIARNVKEVRKQVSHIVNLETAALQKAVDAAQRQIADIKTLLRRKTRVSKKIREAMDMRLQNPSCTIGELAEKFSITRNALACRLQKIHRLAKRYRRK